jgi:adenylate cyclase
MRLAFFASARRADESPAPRRARRGPLSLNTAALTVASIVAVAVLYRVGVPILDLVELRTYDLRFAARGELAPASPVALALIDEKSLAVEGRWPWPRSRMAALVDRLSADGARVIAFDIGFLEPDENSQLRLVEDLARTVDALRLASPRLETFIAETRRHADTDLALAEAIRRSPAAIVLGYFFHKTEADAGQPLETRAIEDRFDLIHGSRYPVVRFAGVPGPESPFLRVYAPVPNLPLLTRVAASSGYFSLHNDPDGAVRWMPLAIQGGEDVYPSLAVLAAWHYLGRPPLSVRVGPEGVEGVQLGPRRVPTDERGQLLINYLGPPGTFRHHSIADVLAGRVAADAFRDRIVLVGATATGTHDLRPTPVSPVFPGVEIHATVIDNILTGRFLARPGWSRIFDLLAIAALAGVMGAVLPRLRAVPALLFAASLFAGHLVLARWLFVSRGVWLSVVYPLLGLATAYIALTVYRYLTEERERRRIKDAFQHYVPPVVIEAMLRDPKRLVLGGEEKVLTVLFSDVEGFTTYSERYAPAEMRNILSDYFERMTQHVFAHQGTLMEYVGDELLAVFGAPLEQADHPHRACAAALAMREERAVLRQEWARIGRPLLRARTGINSGPMLVGNLGSRYRFAYGVLGDQVNLGSRLEGLNKVYATEILIGENTARLVYGAFLLREVDMVRVKGRVQPVRIYELLAPAGRSLPLEQQKALSSYGAGLEAYRQQRWDDALGLFAECRALAPDDGPALTMAARARIYQATPPPEDWDGVFVQTEK